MLNPITKLRINAIFSRNLLALSFEERADAVGISNLDRVYVSPESITKTSKLKTRKDRYWPNIINYTRLPSRALTEHITYIFLEEILRDGKDWNATSLFKEITSGRTINRSINCNGVWRKHVKITSKETFYSYYVNCMDLIRSIEQIGYIDVKHGDPELIERYRGVQGGLASPVSLAIDHEGTLLHHTRGHHRISIAKLLRIPRLPVSVEFISGEYFNRFLRYSDLSTEDRFIDAIKRAVDHAVRPYLAR